MTPAQKHCFPLFGCHTILTSSRKTPPPSLCPPSFSNITGQSWKSLSSLSPVFRSLSPYGCWWEGRVRQGAKQMSAPRMDSAPRGKGGDSWYSLYTLETHAGRAGICFKEESTCPWLLNDAVALQRAHKDTNQVENQWKNTAVVSAVAQIVKYLPTDTHLISLFQFFFTYSQGKLSAVDFFFSLCNLIMTVKQLNQSFLCPGDGSQRSSPPQPDFVRWLQPKNTHKALSVRHIQFAKEGRVTYAAAP